MSPEERVHATVWNCGHLSPNPGVCGTCLHAAIVAAEADARREALEEAATLFDAASRRDTTIEIAAAVRACAMQLRALASQKGEP